MAPTSIVFPDPLFLFQTPDENNERFHCISTYFSISQCTICAILEAAVKFTLDYGVMYFRFKIIRSCVQVGINSVAQFYACETFSHAILVREYKYLYITTPKELCSVGHKNNGM
jgi:hypothetical protein